MGGGGEGEERQQLRADGVSLGVGSGVDWSVPHLNRTGELCGRERREGGGKKVVGVLRTDPR